MSTVSDLQLDYIDAHEGSSVLDKALPPPGKEKAGHLIGNVGSWRSHLDAIRAYVACVSTANLESHGTDADVIYIGWLRMTWRRPSSSKTM